MPLDVPAQDDGRAATEAVRGIDVLRAGRFVSFVAASDVCGPFALADTEFGAALRTPYGTFLER
jgi:hypothetical protein